MKATRSSQAAQQPLFRDDSERVTVTWSMQEGSWVAKCADCSKRLCTSLSKQTCEASALAHLLRHKCGMTGLPADF